MFQGFTPGLLYKTWWPTFHSVPCNPSAERLRYLDLWNSLISRHTLFGKLKFFWTVKNANSGVWGTKFEYFGRRNIHVQIHTFALATSYVYIQWDTYKYINSIAVLSWTWYNKTIAVFFLFWRFISYLPDLSKGFDYNVLRLWLVTCSLFFYAT